MIIVYCVASLDLKDTRPSRRKSIKINYKSYSSYKHHPDSCDGFKFPNIYNTLLHGLNAMW